jgi:hypothetical protein
MALREQQRPHAGRVEPPRVRPAALRAQQPPRMRVEDMLWYFLRALPRGLPRLPALQEGAGAVAAAARRPPGSARAGWQAEP